MSLIAAYAFDEAAGPVLTDAAGDFDLTLTANGALVAGHNGNAVAPVAGTSPAASGAIDLSGVGALTITGRVKVASVGTYASMLSLYDGGVRRLRIGRGSANALHVEAQASSGTNAWIFLPDNTLQTVAFHHVGVRWNRLGDGKLEILLDGVLVTHSLNGSELSTGLFAADTLYVGGDPAAGFGIWDDLRIYDEARSDAQILEDMNTPVTPSAPSNQAPVANAGSDRTVYVGQEVTLNGSASSDADGTVETYEWTKISGPAATLAGSGASRTFTPASTGTYVFGLTVYDNEGLASATDLVNVTAQAVPTVPPSGGPGLKKFPSIERALMNLLVRDLEALEESDTQIGGRFAYDPESMPWYIRIDKVPGGRSNWFEGTFVIDLEVFGEDYLATESVAFDVEALLLGYPHVVEVDGQKVVFDEVSQNVGPADLPWEDDSVHRLGSTYVITARRR